MSQLKDTPEIQQLRQWISDLQTGLYINCVYCGHRYGPNTEYVPAEALHRHIAECMQFPMSKLLGACRVVMSRFARCRVIHCGHPQGFTCLDTREHARDNPSEYDAKFRSELIDTDEHLCDACLMKSQIGELIG